MKFNICDKLFKYDDVPKAKSIAKNTSITAAVMICTLTLSEILYSFGISRQSILLIYLLSLLIISRITTNYIYGIAASVISTLAFDWLVASPRMGFSFTAGSPLTLLTMLATTFFISTLTTQMQLQTKLAVEREQRVHLLYDVNQELLVAQTADEVITLANKYLTGHLRRPAIFFSEIPSVDDVEQLTQSNSVFFSELELQRVRAILGNESPITLELSLKDNNGVNYFSVSSKDHTYGVIGIDCRIDPLTDENISFVQMIAGQMAFALEIKYLSDEQTKIALETEREKVRSTLLSSVSHDLRTPLTSMLGASSAILEQDGLDVKTIRNLVTDIKENVQWLIRMVENILTITKISGGDLHIKKTVEAIEEVVAQAVSIVRGRFPSYSFHVGVPDELLMSPMDATLISQVIINLLENAVKNSPSGSMVLLDLKRNGSFAQLDINDNGKGIPERLISNLFGTHEAHRDAIVDGTRGIGIGLSICKTIITAHGGAIDGKNRKNGGATFSFKIPLEEGDVCERQC